MLKSLVHRVADFWPLRTIVINLVYPTIVRCLKSEILVDRKSPSGLIESIGWKSHAYMVQAEELQCGKICCSDLMASDADSRREILAVVLKNIEGKPGDILEFGVFNGESLVALADACPERQAYGFDSFAGIPEEWWSRPAGSFRNTAAIPERPNIILVRGLFEDSLPEFVQHYKAVPALVHVDCDLYGSTITCLKAVLPLCKPGVVVLFDEYYNYPTFEKHEWLAWRQLRAEYGIKARCIAYDGRRAAFEVISIEEGTARMHSN